MNRRDALKLTMAVMGGLGSAPWGPSTVAAAADARVHGKTANKPGARWSVERASQWYARYPWIGGCNYVPATAVNQLEMWQADTFDPKTIVIVYRSQNWSRLSEDLLSIFSEFLARVQVSLGIWWPGLRGA